MEEIDEGKITGAIDAIPLEKIEKITKQMKTFLFFFGLNFYQNIK
jgi:hypothetical protein